MELDLENDLSKKKDPVADLISNYKELIEKTHFEGETYKWELTKLYHNRPNVDAPDFTAEISDIEFSNLIYLMGIAVSKHISRERPEEYRKAFKNLFNESEPLTSRINQFELEVLRIYREFVPEEKYGTYHDERTVSTFLAFHDSNRYPFFKDGFYKRYCKLAGIQPESKGRKYEHYVNLLNEFIENYILPDKELLELKNRFLPAEEYIDNNQYILAQDILYQMLDKSKEDAVRYWRIGTTNRDKSYWDVMLKNKYVSIGWPELGELSREKIKNRNDVAEIFKSLNEYTDNKSLLTRKSGEVFNFYREMKSGDIVLAQDGSTVLAIGEIIDDYGYDKEALFPHYRPVEWHVINPTDFLNETGKLTTVFQITKPEIIDRINYYLGRNEEQPPVIDIQRNMQKNIILYGPPGTGKTYNSIDKAVEIAASDRFAPDNHDANKLVFDELRKSGQIEFVTFHQNYSYEDFVVGISPDVTSGSLRFEKREGIFKILVDKAKQNWVSATLKEIDEIDFNYVFNSFFKALIEEEVSEVEIPMKSRNYSFMITSIDIDEGRIRFTKKSGGTGHDLLLKNVKRIYEGTLDYGPEGLGVYYYPLNDKLKEFANKLKPQKSGSEKLKNFVLVIDEINRANISKVFGELITLLEDDKRLGADNELKVTLPNGEKEFGIPPNLYIIGTMNTADKSIALIDIALRRRFEFIGYYPKYDGYAQEACNLLKIINSNIFDKKKSPDYLIGHAYFMKKEPMDTVLKNKVLPLLMEYFSGKTEIVRDIFSGSNWIVNYDSTSYSWVIKAE